MAEQKKYKILVAEDDKFLVKALKDKLEREGFETVIALDGEESIAKIKKEKPDLVLLDLVMPLKNGFEVLEEMVLSGDLKKIPVLILSNLGQQADIERGMELGAVDYFVKADVTITAMVKKIKEHLAKVKR